MFENFLARKKKDLLFFSWLGACWPARIMNWDQGECQHLLTTVRAGTRSGKASALGLRTSKYALSWKIAKRVQLEELYRVHCSCSHVNPAADHGSYVRVVIRGDCICRCQIDTSTTAGNLQKPITCAGAPRVGRSICDYCKMLKHARTIFDRTVD